MENPSLDKLEPLSMDTASGAAVATTAETALPDAVLASLYHRYSIKQRRAGLECFLAASILFDLWAIFIPQGQSWDSLGKSINVCALSS